MENIGYLLIEILIRTYLISIVIIFLGKQGRIIKTALIYLIILLLLLFYLVFLLNTIIKNTIQILTFILLLLLHMLFMLLLIYLSQMFMSIILTFREIIKNIFRLKRIYILTTNLSKILLLLFAIIIILS